MKSSSNEYNFTYDRVNPPISQILLCAFVKQHFKYRACDAEENGLQVNVVVRHRHPLEFEKNIILIKNALFEEDREISPKLFFAIARKIF